MVPSPAQFLVLPTGATAPTTHRPLPILYLPFPISLCPFLISHCPLPTSHHPTEGFTTHPSTPAPSPTLRGLFLPGFTPCCQPTCAVLGVIPLSVAGEGLPSWRGHTKGSWGQPHGQVFGSPAGKEPLCSLGTGGNSSVVYLCLFLFFFFLFPLISEPKDYCYIT